MIRGRARELGLGSAELVTLAEAREVALANRRAARAGGDPLAAKREADAVMTFEEAARAVHKAHRPTWRNPKHAAQCIATLKTYAFPHFGKKVSEVTSADVLAALAPIWTKKPETANRVQQRIGTVMDWVIAKGWRKDNPAAVVGQALPKAGKDEKQHRKALPYTEVADCLVAVRASRAAVATKLGARIPGADRGPQRRGAARARERDRPRGGGLDGPGQADEGRQGTASRCRRGRSRSPARMVGRLFPRMNGLNFGTNSKKSLPMNRAVRVSPPVICFNRASARRGLPRSRSRSPGGTGQPGDLGRVPVVPGEGKDFHRRRDRVKPPMSRARVSTAVVLPLPPFRGRRAAPARGSSR